MPYLKQERKDELADEDAKLEAPGELNYLVTLVLLEAVQCNGAYLLRSRVPKLIERYIEANGRSYTTYNNIVGALTCARAEFKRRVPDHLWVTVHANVSSELKCQSEEFYADTVAPYEDEKIAENGDVY